MNDQQKTASHTTDIVIAERSEAVRNRLVKTLSEAGFVTHGLRDRTDVEMLISAALYYNPRIAVPDVFVIDEHELSKTFLDELTDLGFAGHIVCLQLGPATLTGRQLPANVRLLREPFSDRDLIRAVETAAA